MCGWLRLARFLGFLCLHGGVSCNLMILCCVGDLFGVVGFCDAHFVECLYNMLCVESCFGISCGFVLDFDCGLAGGFVVG